MKIEHSIATDRKSITMKFTASNGETAVLDVVGTATVRYVSLTSRDESPPAESMPAFPEKGSGGINPEILALDARLEDMFKPTTRLQSTLSNEQKELAKRLLLQGSNASQISKQVKISYERAKRYVEKVAKNRNWYTVQ